MLTELFSNLAFALIVVEAVDADDVVEGVVVVDLAVVVVDDALDVDRAVDVVDADVDVDRAVVVVDDAVDVDLAVDVVDADVVVDRVVEVVFNPALVV